jgi:response regulator RpfG family c-di-GMP phosphodiesterase
MTAKVLCVDDDTNILAAYHRQMRNHFELETATSAADALKVLQTKGPFAVIVSDMRMPGMDGIQFLTRAKAIAPDTVRIMLTGFVEQRTAINAINEGSIFRFLTKPCATETLTQAVSAGIAQHRLVTAEKELLGQTLRGSIRLLIDVLALVNPAAFGRTARIRQVVKQLVQALNLEHTWEFDIAAMLALIGCVTLPAEVMERIRHGETLTPEETQLWAAHPTVGHDLIARIPRLEAVAEMIRYQDCAFDGSGSAVGARKRGTDIPLGARLLKVALDHDALKSTRSTSVEAVRDMQQRSQLYDPQLLAAMRGIAEAEEALEIRDVSAADLTDHMVLADDVLSRTGMLILSRGQEVTHHLRERLRNYARRAAIREPIRVFAKTD